VLAIGKLDVLASGFGRLSLVDCEFLEFRYEPFVVIQDAWRAHGVSFKSLLNFSG
jgi:hypothetical protein